MHLVTKVAAIQLFVSSLSQAAIIAYSAAPNTAGNQAYGGSLGMDFNVNQDIVITRLGAFDSLGDGLNLSITVEVWDRTNTGAALTSITFPTGTSASYENGHRFLNLGSSLALSAGFQGTIVAHGYGATELNGNSGGGNFTTGNTGGGAISFVGASRYGTASSYPTSVDTGAETRYGAGSFDFIVAVPEPSSAFFLSLSAIGLIVRRKRS